MDPSGTPPQVKEGSFHAQGGGSTPVATAHITPNAPAGPGGSAGDSPSPLPGRRHSRPLSRSLVHPVPLEVREDAPHLRWLGTAGSGRSSIPGRAGS